MNTDKHYAVLIPARYQSSRFPGKPLVDICGQPMIKHVWQRCCQAVGSEKVFIATDNDAIASVVTTFGGQVIMTSSDCLTGTDRLAEANQQLNCDFIINVQGDEPLINPEDIRSVIKEYLSNPEQVVNAMCKINSQEDFHSLNVPKVVCDTHSSLLYMSRAGVPLAKNGDFIAAYKQVCIYAFSKAHLELFYASNQKTPLEAIEDIEILRFLEQGIGVKMVEVAQGSLAVDVPSDVEKIVKKMTASSL
ncbi:MAG: 3-deoxy-manno-octulosonate cytidylyltransferase [Gammaproteobacteria bacterium]|nr:3-deoxy-manno-octulosonate cytidylyltransferase [Gammaproteobacteria bacterium]